MLEQELQSIIYNLLKSGRLISLIDGVSYYKGWLKLDSGDSESFSTRTILLERYAKSVVHIYDKLVNHEYDTIGSESPRSISLDKSNKLFPDIIIHDHERNFFIFELKVGIKTER